MKTLTLEQAHRLISECSACIVDGSELMYPSIAELTGEPDNEFLYLSWMDDDGREFAAICFEENNQTVEIRENKLVLHDDNDDEFTLTLLIPQKID